MGQSAPTRARHAYLLRNVEAPPGFEPGGGGFTDKVGRLSCWLVLLAGRPRSLVFAGVWAVLFRSCSQVLCSGALMAFTETDCSRDSPAVVLAGSNRGRATNSVRHSPGPLRGHASATCQVWTRRSERRLVTRVPPFDEQPPKSKESRLALDTPEPAARW